MVFVSRSQVYAAVLELCLRTVRTSLTAGRNKEDLLTQWYTGLPPQAIVGPGSRKLHLGALKYLVQVRAGVYALPCRCGVGDSPLLTVPLWVVLHKYKVVLPRSSWSHPDRRPTSAVFTFFWYNLRPPDAHPTNTPSPHHTPT